MIEYVLERKLVNGQTQKLATLRTSGIIPFPEIPPGTLPQHLYRFEFSGEVVMEPGIQVRYQSGDVVATKYA